KLKETPSYRTLAHEMTDQQIRVFGDIAIVTGNFRLVTEFKSAHPNDLPHVDEGRYTGIFQKRDGRWLLLMDHDSEKPHDKPMMEKQVAALSRAYTDMIKRNDANSIAKILADDYIVTDEEGKRLTKAEDLATYKDRAVTLKIETVEYKDQKVRMLTGNVAVDHSTIRFAGTNSGKPFDITERITTTWQFRDGRWLIVADHFSFVKPQ
ncbi:MAG: nuclear transport factor 2 family protein, partial [bacterium]|nr:nuclear transport factor 2 family protein [bacterium]